MQYITIFDYLLLPVYLFIFYIIVKKISVKYPDAELRKYFFVSFYLHMFGAVAYALPPPVKPKYFAFNLSSQSLE